MRMKYRYIQTPQLIWCADPAVFLAYNADYSSLARLRLCNNSHCVSILKGLPAVNVVRASILKSRQGRHSQGWQLNLRRKDTFFDDPGVTWVKSPPCTLLSRILSLQQACYLPYEAIREPHGDPAVNAPSSPNLPLVWVSFRRYSSLVRQDWGA